MKPKISTDDFIKRAKHIHREKYDYSQVVYINAKSKIEVICKEHGLFLVTPDNHCSKKSGCSNCRNIKLSEIFRDTTESFVKKARLFHGDKYDYSLVEYGKRNRDKVTIICKLHGEFLQSPNDHLNGCGCPECGGTLKQNLNKFIISAKSVHGEKYNYSKSMYINNRSKIEIVCPLHGSFKQRVYGHLSGKGCPICCHQISKPEMKFLDILGIPDSSCNRQKIILKFKVDGIKRGKIFEFLGDYYHGNPKIYHPKDFNKKCKKTFGELYNKTIEKFNKLNQLGYHIYYMWERDWEDWNKKKLKTFPIKKFMYISNNKEVTC